MIAFDDDRTADRTTRQKEFAAYQAQQGFVRGKQTPSVTASGAGSGTVTTRQTPNISRAPSSATMNPSASTVSTLDKPQLPPMSMVERDLLRQNHGCFKCCQVFVYHTRDNCPNGSPDARTFRVVTAAAIASIKAKMATVAATIVGGCLPTIGSDGTSVSTPTMVAAIAVESPPAMPLSNVLGSGSDPETDECVSPTLVSPPLHLHGVIHSPSASSEVMSMLIDSGSSAVLIREDVIACLQLRRRTLNSPLALNNAWDAGGGAAMEWVKLWVSTPSFHWNSIACRAVVVPALVAPVILGLPFLEINHFAIDATGRTLRDTRSGMDILTPSPPTSPPLPTPDSHALDRELAFLHDEELAAQKRDVLRELCLKHPPLAPRPSPPLPIAAVRARVESLAAAKTLRDQLAGEDR